MKNSFKHTGFTLLELLVTISIVAILVAAAVPSMQSTNKKGQVKSSARALSSAFAYARGEAVARNKLVTICPSSDGSSCGTNWSDGWITFIDDGAGTSYGNGNFESAQEEILQSRTLSSSTNISIVDGANATTALNSISWNFRGNINGGGRAVAIICPTDDDVTYARGLVVERTGRVMSTSDANSSGVHDSAFEDDNGNVSRSDLSC